MAITTVSNLTPPPAKKALWKNLTVQVLAAIVLGVVYGHYFPESASGLKFLGDAFIKLIKMVIGPIVFLTVVIGISGMGDMKKVGKVGAKAIIYFEIVTTFALILGMAVANLLKPGAGLNMSAIEKGDISKYTEAAKHQSTLDFVLHIIPDNIVGAFAKGELLQILFVALLFGAALAATGEKGKPVEAFLERVTATFFGIISIIMYAAPIGAFGAIAYTIGTYGIASLLPLGKLIFHMLLAMGVFIFCILGLVCRWYGFSLWKFIRYIKEEMLIVLGTSSSESVLPNMMEKLQKLGCSKPVVGLVIPTGYSFNLDGTSIYLSMAVIFIAQAFNIELTIGQELGILGVLLLTSKGAAGVTGAGFITLAATLSATHSLPVEGLALLIGIDRFMSTARAITNLIGNGIATVVVAKMEKEFDEKEALATYREYFKDPEISKV